MSRKNIVNKDRYTTACPERQGEGLVHEARKRPFARAGAGAAVSGEGFFNDPRDESARKTQPGKLKPRRGLSKSGKPRGLSAKQLMERRIRARHAKKR